MERKEYNGWTNYETWATALWLDNDEGAQSYWDECAGEALDSADGDADEAANDLAKRIEDEHEQRAEELGLLDGSKSGIFSDLVSAALSEVNWREIAEHYIDTAKERVS